jgi:hypothetical protein
MDTIKPGNIKVKTLMIFQSYVSIEEGSLHCWVVIINRRRPQRFSGHFLAFITMILKTNTCLWYITIVLTKIGKKFAIKLPVLYWFFRENHSLFKFFEITRIGSFLVLSFLQRIGTSGSLILKYFRSWNWWFFKNSHNRTTLIVCLFCVFEISQTTNGVYLCTWYPIP